VGYVLRKWWVHICICARGGIASCAVGLGFVCVVFGRADCYSISAGPCISSLFSSIPLSSQTVQLTSRIIRQQQQQCAALCQTRATWKLEYSKTPCLHGSRAFTTMYAIFFGNPSLGLFTSLRQHHQGRLPTASFQVRSQNPSLDVSYDQKVLQRLHQCLSMERCQACYFPHGAVSPAVLHKSTLPQPDIQT
jgi:hypothetical protein